MVMGNGLGLWNIIPIRVLTSRTSASGPYMFCPLYSTRPSTLHPSTRSFILLKALMSVDLPHPDGPINAVILFLRMGIETSNNAWFFPYHRLRFLTFMAKSVFSFKAITISYS